MALGLLRGRLRHGCSKHAPHQCDVAASQEQDVEGSEEAVNLGDVIRTPSGSEVTLSPLEEREIVKDVLATRIKNNMLLASDVRKSAISALGTAIGLAVGGLLVGYFIRKK